MATTGDTALRASGAARTVTNAISLGGGTTLTLNAASSFDLTLSGAITGAGGLLKAGTTTLTLSGTGKAFSGGLTVNGGTVNGPGNGSLGSVAGVVNLNAGQQVFTGSTTTARTFNLVTGTLVAASGTPLTYAGTRVNGGSLGMGTQILASGTTLNGTRVSGTTLSQSGGPVTFNNVLLSGSTNFTQATNTTLDVTGDFTANPLTTLVVNGSVDTRGGSILGGLTINNGGSVVTNGGSFAPLYLDGSRGTTVNQGGQLVAAGSATIELGGLLINNGRQTGTLNVNLDGVVRGTGSFGTVNANSGATFGVNTPATGDGSAVTMGFYRPSDSDGLASALFVGPLLASVPGSSSVVSLTMGSGSAFAFRVQNAPGAAGTGYDSVHITGTLTLAAGTAAGSQITINVGSLARDGTNGAAANFDPNQNYTFVLARADGASAGLTRQRSWSTRAPSRTRRTAAVSRSCGTAMIWTWCFSAQCLSPPSGRSWASVAYALTLWRFTDVMPSLRRRSIYSCCLVCHLVAALFQARSHTAQSSQESSVGEAHAPVASLEQLKDRSLTLEASRKRLRSHCSSSGVLLTVLDSSNP